MTSSRWLLVLLLVAFMLRLAAGWVWQARCDGPFRFPDSYGYWELGRAIAEGQPYECGPDHAKVYRTPGYPLLLAPIIWAVGDNLTAIRLARAEAALFGTLAVLAVWWLGRMLFNERVGLWGAALATFYPGAVAFGAFILSEAPFCPLILLQLGLWILADRASTSQKSITSGFCSGLAAGAATLMRPSWLLFIPFAGMIELGWAGRSKNRSLLVHHGVIVSCMMFGFLVAMSPWWIRNAVATGKFVPTTLMAGASLYDGLSPVADGSSDMRFMERFEAEEKEKMAQNPPSPSSKDTLEVRLDRRLFSESLQWIMANPGQVLRLAGVKFLRIWNFWPNEPSFSSWPIRLAMLFTYTPILIFAIIGGVRTLGRGWSYSVCWLPALYITLLHMVFIGSIRYREPAMLALLVIAAAGIEQGMRDWGLGMRKKTAS